MNFMRRITRISIGLLLCYLWIYNCCNSQEYITCGFPGTPANGEMMATRKEAYNIGEIVNYSCNQGHIRKGQNSIRCGEEGLWVKRSFPLCVKNLAYKRSASQSSTKDKFEADLGVDGNPATCAETMNAKLPSFWEVQLDREYNISSIKLSISLSGEESTNISVVMDDNECKRNLSLTSDKTDYEIDTFCSNETKFAQGHKIRIESEKTQLRICEVQIFDANENECGEPDSRPHCTTNVIHDANPKIVYYYPKEGYQIRIGYTHRMCVKSKWRGFPPICELVPKKETQNYGPMYLVVLIVISVVFICILIAVGYLLHRMKKNRAPSQSVNLILKPESTPQKGTFSSNSSTLNPVYSDPLDFYKFTHNEQATSGKMYRNTTETNNDPSQHDYYTIKDIRSEDDSSSFVGKVMYVTDKNYIETFPEVSKEEVNGTLSSVKQQVSEL